MEWLGGAATWPHGHPEERRRQPDALLCEDANLPAGPTFQTPLELLDYMINNVDVLDLLVPAT